jgi:hypothetical protein
MADSRLPPRLNNRPLPPAFCCRNRAAVAYRVGPRWHAALPGAPVRR